MWCLTSWARSSLTWMQRARKSLSSLGVVLLLDDTSRQDSASMRACSGS